MALSRLNYNSFNVTPTASKGIGFDSGADDLAATFSGGSMTFIKKLTASTSSTLSFVDGTSDVVLDNTYKEYLFTWNNLHPGTNSVHLTFQANSAGGADYNETMTTTQFRAYYNEAGNDDDLEYVDADQAQGTSFQNLGGTINTGNDNSTSGILQLFNPSSTTFVKHFIATAQEIIDDSYSMQYFTAGYFNTTSAIDEIQFKFSSGNIDAGDICLYVIN